MAKIYATVDIILDVECDDVGNEKAAEAEVEWFIRSAALMRSADMTNLNKFQITDVSIDEERTIYDPVEPPETEEESRR